jgi:para-nitrobenzyl esterase
MPPLQRLLFAALHVNRQSGRLLFAGDPRTPTYMPGRTPILDGRPGPFHAAELAFTFGNAELCDHYSGGSIGAIVLSKQISTAWVSFARTGNPNHDDLPYWPKYTSERRATMQFDSTCVVRNDPEGEGLRLIAAA